MLIITRNSVVFYKSSSLPKVEITKGPKHATKMKRFSFSGHEKSLLDKFFMVISLCVDGAYLENPSDCVDIRVFNSSNFSQRLVDTLLITSILQFSIYAEPNKNIFHKKSTVGFPKRLKNSQGDGALIVRLNFGIKIQFKVEQQCCLYSFRAICTGPEIFSKLTKLDNGKFIGLYKCLITRSMLFRSYVNVNGGSFSNISNLKLSLDIFTKLSDSLRNESFQFQFLRSSESLSIRISDNELVYESMRLLLEYIFKPVFLNFNQAFRFHKRRYSALKCISA